MPASSASSPVAPGPPRRLTATDRLTLFVLVAALPLIAWGLSRLDLENDIENWLPENDSGSQVLAWHHEHFDPLERFLVSWDSSSLDDPRVERLAEELALPPDDEDNGVRKGRSPEIERVSTPRDLIARMVDNKVPLDQAIENATGVAIGRGFLKVRLTPAGRQDEAALRERVLAALIDLGLQPEILAQIPTSPTSAEAAAEASTATSAPSGSQPAKLLTPQSHDFQIRWQGLTPASPEGSAVIESLSELLNGRDEKLIDAAFFEAGSPVAVTITLTPTGSDAVTRTVNLVRDAATRAGIPQEELRFGGGPVARSRLSREAIRSLWNEDYPIWNLYKRSPVLLSVLVGVLLALVLLKSLRLTIIVLLASLYVCCATVALVPALGDRLNMVLIIMPTLLFVVTMSGAIHLANHWRHESARGSGDAVERALRSARLPCALSSITTAIGTASLYTSRLLPIRQFGVYSTIGVLLSLAMVLFGVPALLRLAAGHGLVSREERSSLWRSLGRTVARYHWATMFLMLLVFSQAVWGLVDFRTETKVIRYFPNHLRIIQDYDFFEQSLAGVVNVDVILHFSRDAIEATDVGRRLELVRATEAALAGDPGVTGTLSIADICPVHPPLEEDASLTEKLFYKRGMNRLYKGIFGTTATASPSDEESADPLSDAERLPRISSASLASLVHRPLELEHEGRRVSLAQGDEAWRIRVQCTVLKDISYEQLLAQVGQRVRNAIDRSPGVSFLVTGTVPLFLRAQQALLNSLIWSFGLAFALITLVMMLLLRSILGGIYAMLPNIWPVGVSFGWVSWMGIPIDIGTMMTASIAVGIAIDGTLHLITWFEDCLTRERHRAEAVRDAMDLGGPALFQTSAIIALGILMLSGADLLLISRFGWLMALLIITALLGDIILLPALLAGRLGLLIRGPLSTQATGKAAHSNRYREGGSSPPRAAG